MDDREIREAYHAEDAADLGPGPGRRRPAGAGQGPGGPGPRSGRRPPTTARPDRPVSASTRPRPPRPTSPTGSDASMTTDNSLFPTPTVRRPSLSDLVDFEDLAQLDGADLRAVFGQVPDIDVLDALAGTGLGVRRHDPHQAPGRLGGPARGRGRRARPGRLPRRPRRPADPGRGPLPPQPGRARSPSTTRPTWSPDPARRGPTPGRRRGAPIAPIPSAARPGDAPTEGSTRCRAPASGRSRSREPGPP